LSGFVQSIKDRFYMVQKVHVIQSEENNQPDDKEFCAPENGAAFPLPPVL